MHAKSYTVYVYRLVPVVVIPTITVWYVDVIYRLASLR